MYRRTETPLQLIQPAGRVCICVWETQSTCCSPQVLRASIWWRFDLISAKGGRWRERLRRTRNILQEGCENRPKQESNILPLLSLMEKLWLWATSGARLKEKCCLWPISSLSAAEMVSMVWITRATTSSVGNRDFECPLNYIQLRSDVQTYLPRHGGLTHEDLSVGRELWRVVVHVFDSDVDANFGVLMMAACAQTHRPRHMSDSAVYTAVHFH